MIDLPQVRDGVSLGQTGVELVIESRDRRHGSANLAGVRGAGYSVILLG